MNIKDQIRAEIDKRYAEYRAKMKTDDFTYYEGMADALDLFEQFLDTLPEQPVEYPTSTEMIAEWENNELPMLREKDFRGDAERMAYNAFMDGFAKGLGYRK